MLRVLGGPKRLCDGLTRRDLLHVGAAELLGGLGREEWGGLQAAEAGVVAPAATAGFGKAKACILLLLYGSPRQLRDVRPQARHCAQSSPAASSERSPRACLV